MRCYRAATAVFTGLARPRRFNSTMSCCGPSSSCEPDGAKTLEQVQDYYGKVLSTSKDLKTSACTAAGRPHPLIIKAIKEIPKPIVEKFYGCGAPLPMGIEGLRVLDLGSGSGRDCYVCSRLVGEKGSVTGIDMTDEQLDVARAHIDEYTKKLGYAKPNLRFVKGYIEKLKEAGIEDECRHGHLELCGEPVPRQAQRAARGVPCSCRWG
eukprot:Sspe_Gene.4731::Locus_1557_Transcript_4_5_Confidence_0.222_Length_1590::g.4731::m.4731/K07755/AS3MT; arsenite methyltransferase